ncbi:MAG: hypothetical protein EON92_15525 [Burkholderiales bacterium]|nr:MAG: hypothetical protein EON92_15525 [Burkholderiales bacterium]
MKHRFFSLVAACLLGCTCLSAVADAGELRAKHAELRDQLRSNSYQRALHIDSAESSDTLRGDVYAVLDHPFEKTSDALKNPARWCDILILPFNTKYCHAVDTQAGPGLQVRIGRKYDQPVKSAYKIDFGWRNVAASPTYFESRLDAGNGPLGTRDYRITLAAIPLESGQTFVHLSYSYGYGMAGKLAMQSYLATIGADKIGFTVTGRDANGKPQHIGGMRGAVERNAMRYYLAIDSYLDSLALPPGQQAEKRIQNWFTETERYPRQLHEMDRGKYVAMKRQEVERQQTLLQ